MSLPTSRTNLWQLQASTPDLIALSLVSKHFHHLAASRLYREFRIVFPDVDYLTSDKPIDALACGLDTFTTSDYNYAQHLRSITLESTESGEKAERAYKLYSMEKSCGKFMNTLFMLTLKKARKLDTFRWDIRVEISRPTFQALHNLPTLQHLHLRLQPGRSTYEIPPSLQKPSISHGTKDTFLSEPSAFDLGTTSIGTGHDPPTLSGFKNLQSLSILDMDNRDYIPETRACIRNSAHTLRRLHLSFSEKLAQSSRAPIARTPVEVIELDAQMAASDDDYMTDDWGHVPGPPPPPITSSEDESHGGLSKALKAKEERAQQESVLARILGVPSAVTGEVVAAAKVNGVKDTLLKPTDMVDIEPLVQCHKKLASIIKLFVKTSYKGQGHEQTQKDILNLVEKTSTEILELQKKSAKTLTTEAVDTNTTTAAALGAEASTSEADIASETAVGDVLPAITTALNGQKTEVPTEVSTMFEQIPKKKKVKISDFTPEDIDLDAPEIEVGSGVFEDIEAGEAQQDAASEIDSARNTGYGGDKLKALSRAAQARHGHLKVMQRKHEALHRRLRESDTHAGLLSKRIQEMGRVPGGTKPSVLREMRRELENLQVSMVDIGEQLNQMSFDVDQQLLFTEALSDSNAYTNTTRGLQLTELALYLIPLRPSVLENAIDMHALQSITLLNVGPQDKFWSSLSVLNKEEPLKLKSVFSDNASLPLLQLLGSLHDLEDLFLMEGRKKPLPRDGRRPPTQPTRATQLAPRTIVKLDAIRKKVLRRHMGSLKRLVINNWDDKSWDADEVFIKMVCRKGKQLEELGLSMDPRATVSFRCFLVVANLSGPYRSGEKRLLL